MPDIDTDERAFLRDHRRSFASFSRLVLFAVLQIALSLACLALAYPGHAKPIGYLIWGLGTAALVLAIALHRGRR